METLQQLLEMDHKIKNTHVPVDLHDCTCVVYKIHTITYMFYLDYMYVLEEEQLAACYIIFDYERNSTSASYIAPHAERLDQYRRIQMINTREESQ